MKIRLMGNNAAEVTAAAPAVVAALAASPDLLVGDVSDPVPNRGHGCRVYIEVLLARRESATDGGYAVDVEVVDREPLRPARRIGNRRALPRGS